MVRERRGRPRRPTRGGRGAGPGLCCEPSNCAVGRRPPETSGVLVPRHPPGDGWCNIKVDWFILCSSAGRVTSQVTSPSLHPRATDPQLISNFPNISSIYCTSSNWCLSSIFVIGSVYFITHMNLSPLLRYRSGTAGQTRPEPCNYGRVWPALTCWKLFLYVWE